MQREKGRGFGHLEILVLLTVAWEIAPGKAIDRPRAELKRWTSLARG